MNLLFAFRYRKMPYILMLIMSAVLLVSGLVFLLIAFLLYLAFRRTMVSAVFPLFLVSFSIFPLVLLVNLLLIVYSSLRLSPSSYVISGTAEALTVQGPFLRKRTYAWPQIEYIHYLPAGTALPGSRSIFAPWGYRHRRSYLYVKPYHDKAARIDVSFLDGQIEDVFSCFSRIKPDLIIMEKGGNPL